MKNKCPKTMSGEHIYKEPSPNDSYSISIDARICIACGMIDDRKKKK